MAPHILKGQKGVEKVVPIKGEEQGLGTCIGRSPLQIQKAKAVGNEELQQEEEGVKKAVGKGLQEEYAPLGKGEPGKGIAGPAPIAGAHAEKEEAQQEKSGSKDNKDAALIKIALKPPSGEVDILPTKAEEKEEKLPKPHEGGNAQKLIEAALHKEHEYGKMCSHSFSS